VNVFPSDDGRIPVVQAVNIPWLAFCSGKFLRKGSTDIPMAIPNLRRKVEDLVFTDQRRSFDDDLGLPRILSVFAYQKQIETQSTNGGTNGALVFHYEVLESTNFLGWNLPLRFQFLQNERSKQGKWSARYQGIGRVTSISDSTKPDESFVPDLCPTVVDWRFSDKSNQIDAIIYKSTNAMLLPTNEATLQQRFKKKIEQASRIRSKSQSTRVVIAALIFLGVPIAVTSHAWPWQRVSFCATLFRGLWHADHEPASAAIFLHRHLAGREPMR
jgi:hypothetical protein